MDDNQEWDGVERRSGKDRREESDRRTGERSIFNRRSGQDRRGHPLYRRAPKKPKAVEEIPVT
ncbi:MAG: hypothetical protein ACR2JC_16945 [Chloroflexota bacterium]|nr:MAG: hypothetical protein DLM70_09055 [Chloroflexota bacterium]